MAARARLSSGVSSSSESVRVAGTPVRGASSAEHPFGDDDPTISRPVHSDWARHESKVCCWGVLLGRCLGHEARLWVTTA
jgi:hypothetical protein